MRVVDIHDEKKALWGLSQTQQTMITRIFGSQQQPGHLFFDDAHQSDQERALFDGGGEDNQNVRGKYTSVQTSIYTQVRLDRPTRTSVPGALFTSEFGIRGFSFEGSIDGWLECTPINNVKNGPTHSLLLLLAGLCLLDAIGGNKSTGKGRCSCEITALTVNEEPQRQWEEWFDHLGALADYADVVRGEAQR
jgi:CRISPR/Cas system CSM-associated protein Csm3 (group 7 of RAMP superfamily)